MTGQIRARPAENRTGFLCLHGRKQLLQGEPPEYTLITESVSHWNRRLMEKAFQVIGVLKEAGNLTQYIRQPEFNSNMHNFYYIYGKLQVHQVSSKSFVEFTCPKF